MSTNISRQTEIGDENGVRRRTNNSTSNQETSSNSQDDFSNSPNSNTTTPNNSHESEKEERNTTKNPGSDFECNVCLDSPSQPVISMCGHLFCWPCIFEWMNRGNKVCPVCKSSIDREKLIPLYGKGKENKDPRQSNPIPERPQGHRTEAPRERFGGFFNYPEQNGFHNYHNNGVHFTGAAFVPFGFGFGFSTGTALTPQQQQQEQQDMFFSRIFFFLGVIVLLIILNF